jgi:cytochrome c biogenesis protein CcmG, thiol:disulfide interchange protein DsbE
VSVGALTVAWTAAVLALAGCATAGGEAGAGTKGRSSFGGGGGDVGRPAPDLVVERLDGKPLALSSLRGKVVLLDVWASWCPPCLKELPMLDAMAKRLRSHGVEIVAVSVDQKRANVVKFLDSQPRWSLTIAHDPRQQIADTLQPEKMPTSYAIDRAGVIRYVNGGFEPSDAPIIERKLLALAEGN